MREKTTWTQLEVDYSRSVLDENGDFIHGVKPEEELYDEWRLVRMPDLTYTFIDMDGHPIKAKFAKRTTGFYLGFAKVQLPNGRFTFLRDDMKLMNTSFPEALYFSEQDWAWVRLDNGNTSFINKKGEMFGHEFLDVKDDERLFVSGWTKVRLLDGSYTLVNKDGQFLGRTFERLGSIKGGYMMCRHANGKYTFMINEADERSVAFLDRAIRAGQIDPKEEIVEYTVIERVMAQIPSEKGLGDVYIDTEGNMWRNRYGNLTRMARPLETETTSENIENEDENENE